MDLTIIIQGCCSMSRYSYFDFKIPLQLLLTLSAEYIMTYSLNIRFTKIVSYVLSTSLTPAFVITDNFSSQMPKIVHQAA